MRNFREPLATLIKNYSGYSPTMGFFASCRAHLHGHGINGYQRKLRLEAIMEKNQNEKTLLSDTINFFIEESKSTSAKNSDLMKSLARLLQSVLAISENEIKKHSPSVLVTGYLSACDGACSQESYETRQGFLNALKSRQAMSLQNVSFVKPMLRCAV